MVETMYLKSGLLAVATFACRSSLALYESTKSLRVHPKQVRDLLEELVDLNAELNSLTDLARAQTDVDLSGLSLPLLRCGNACLEFQQETLRSLPQSSDSRSIIRCWAQFRYMGDGIDGFRNLLAHYKMTFRIVLTDANLRRTSFTAERLQHFKALIETGKVDLEDRLKSTYGKLEQVLAHSVDSSDSDASKLQLMQERLNVEKCLQICNQLSDHFNHIQVTHEPSSPESLESDVFPEIITTTSLKECKNSLLLAKEKLEKHLKTLIDALLTDPTTVRATEEDVANTTKLLEEWETIRKCLDICSKADKHAEEAAGSFDKAPTCDAIQFLISTEGSVIHGRNRGLGWRTRQVGGLISDATLQQLSQDMCTIEFPKNGNGRLPSLGDKSTVPEDALGIQSISEFEKVYGRGRSLTGNDRLLYQFLKSASGDQTIMIWNQATGQCISTLQMPHGLVQSVSWSHNWTRINSAEAIPKFKVHHCEDDEWNGREKRIRLESPTTVQDEHALTSANIYGSGAELDAAQSTTEGSRKLSVCSEGNLSSVGSSETDITNLELEMDVSIDAGISQPRNLDHILDAAGYYDKLDKLELETAQICGIDQGLKAQPELLGEFSVAFRGYKAALCNLKSEGFCGSIMTVLIEDPLRPDVAKAVHVSLDEIDSVLNSLPSMTASHGLPLTEDARSLILRLIRRLNVDPTMEQSPLIVADWQAYLHFLSMVLCIGLVSFAGSHVCRFDINIWKQPMQEISVGFGYTFSLRQLACLDDFIGGPAWILGKSGPHLKHRTFKISLEVQNFHELWGPIWLLGGYPDKGPILRTERGYIIPLPRHQQQDIQLQEIECHWTRDIPEYLMSPNESEESILLSSTSRILIGTEEIGFDVNHSCKTSISLIQQRIAHQLQFPGTCKAQYIADGFEVQLTGGYYVTAALAKKYRRIPQRTLKSRIIEECNRYPDTVSLTPLLKLQIGLEVSACTGNAKRVTLWDALRLSQATTNPTNDSPNCYHRIGDISCISSCWTRYCDSGELDSQFKVHKEGRALTVSQARRAIIKAILALEYTGIDNEGNLQACWPFTDSFMNHRISSSKETHSWFRVVKDTRDVSTFAVMSQRCLEFRQKGIARLCTSLRRNKISGPLQTVLCTRVLLNSAFALDAGADDQRLNTPPREGLMPALQNAEFLLGEAHLTTRRALQKDLTLIIIAVSSNPWQRRLRTVLAERKIPSLQEQMNLDITTGVLGLLFAY